MRREELEYVLIQIAVDQELLTRQASKRANTGAGEEILRAKWLILSYLKYSWAEMRSKAHDAASSGVANRLEKT